MATTLLWRLKGDPQAVSKEKMIQGLRNHLATDDLTVLVMQIGAVQQQYIVLPACEGCATGACAIGCRAALLERVLRASGGEGCQMHALRLGLSFRPYTRAMLAWPTHHAQPLSGTLLTAWPDARLSLHWRQGVLRRHITLAALLLVGADGPAPAPCLRAAGWRCLPLPHFGGRLARLLTRPLPPAWLATFGRPWSGGPWLVAPTQEHTPASTEEPIWNTLAVTDPALSDPALHEPSVTDTALSVEPLIIHTHYDAHTDTSGWAVVHTLPGMVECRMGSLSHMTAERAFLSTLLRELFALPEDASVWLATLTPFPVLLLHAYRPWVWRMQDWREEGQPIPDADLWAQLLPLIDQRYMTWHMLTPTQYSQLEARLARELARVGAQGGREHATSTTRPMGANSAELAQ